MANPTLLDMPIARDGNKNAIPTTDNGTTGLLSQQYGWQLINAIPPQQGGKAVKREDFNGALYLLSNLLFYLQKGWQFEWDSSQAYYAGCIVKDTSDGKMYQCLNDTTSTVAPHSDTTNWKLWDLSAYLPLSGGTMTGSKIYADNGSHYLQIYGGPASDDSGYFLVTGSQYQGGGDTAGRFAIKACAGSIDKYEMWLEGYRTGELKYFKKDSGGNVIGPYDLGDSAIVAESKGNTNGYTKRTSGELLQWGNTVGINAGNSLDITFPISFTGEATFGLGFGPAPGTSNKSYTISNVTKEGFKVTADAYISKGIKWIAFGK